MSVRGERGKPLPRGLGSAHAEQRPAAWPGCHAERATRSCRRYRRQSRCQVAIRKYVSQQPFSADRLGKFAKGKNRDKRTKATLGLAILRCLAQTRPAGEAAPPALAARAAAAQDGGKVSVSFAFAARSTNALVTRAFAGRKPERSEAHIAPNAQRHPGSLPGVKSGGSAEPEGDGRQGSVIRGRSISSRSSSRIA